MDYTAEQINSAFDNIPPLRSKAMFRFDIDSISDEIVKKYGLDEGKGSTTKTNIIFTIIELMSFEDFKQFTIKDLGLPYDRASDLASDVEKMLLIPIKEKIEDFKNEEEIIEGIKKSADELDVPHPPYIPYVPEETKKETPEKPIASPVPNNVEKKEIKTEDEIYQNNGIEIDEDESNVNEIELSDNTSDLLEKKAVNALGDSGIDVVEEAPLKKEEIVSETEKNLMDDVEHPENIARNILMDKLRGNSLSSSVVSDHSLPKINSDK